MLCSAAHTSGIHLGTLGGDADVAQLPADRLLLGEQLPEDHAERVDIDLWGQAAVATPRSM